MLEVNSTSSGTDDPEPARSPEKTRTRKWVGISAIVVAIVAVTLSVLFQYRPAEGTGSEIYAAEFIKESALPFDESELSHSEQEELDMIHESFDWAIDQLNANHVKVGQGNVGNAMFNFLHDESYQKCEEQNAQFMHLSSYYLNMKSYKLDHYRIGLAFDSKWIIEDTLPLKKHVWGIVVAQDAANEPMPADSRFVTKGIIDPWKGHTRLQDPQTYTGFAGVQWIPESVEFISPSGGSSYWEH